MKTTFKIVLFIILLTLSASAQIPDTRNSDKSSTVPPSRGAGQAIRFEHISIEQGLSQSTIHCILQDREGFMWFGTQDGLNKYDGYRFTVYKSDIEDPYSLSSNIISSLYEDRAGDLWIGTRSGLDRFDRETERFHSYQHSSGDPHSVSNNVVTAIYEDQTGALWIGTFGGGLNRFDRNTEQFQHYRHDPDVPWSLSHDYVYSIYETREGELWVGTWGGGLNRLVRSTEQFYRYQHNPDDPQSLSNNYVYSIYEDEMGVLWVGTKGGLNRLDRDAGQFRHYRHNQENPTSLGNDNVRVIYTDQTGELWLGTRGGGLNRFDRNTEQFQSYRHDTTDPHSLRSDDVWSVYEDREGILWIGTRDGLHTFDRNTEQFRHYRHDPNDPRSLVGNNLRAMYEDRAGIVWIGTWGDGLSAFDPDTKQFYPYQYDPDDSQSLSDNFVLSIYEDRSGVLWIGTFGGGLNRLDRETGQFFHYRHDPGDPRGLSHDMVLSIHEDRTETLWIGTFGGGLNRFDRDTGQFHQYRHDPDNPHSLGSNFVISMYEDRTGIFWISTSNAGLQRFDRDTQQFYQYRHEPGNPQSLSSDDVAFLYEDRAGTLWIGTNNGLNKFIRETETFIRYNEKHGLPNATIHGILEDQASPDGEGGNLWLSTNQGLSKFNPQTETFRNYDMHDGLQSNVFNSRVSCKRQDGEMFFGGINGFNAFYPEKIKDNPYIPPVVITGFQLANKPVAIGADSVLQHTIIETEALTLSYKDRVISFEFAALSYAAPEKNRYKYRLEGFEEEWNEVDSSRRYVTYTNLDSGDYVFQVLGSNNDGVWNEEGTSIKITITPPWWETTWFRGVLFVLVVSLVIGGYRWRVSALEHKRRQLEIQVKERTKDLQESEARFHVLSDATFEGIGFTNQGRMVDANQQFARMLGYEMDEIKGMDVSKLVMPEDRELVRSRMLASSEEPYEHRALRKDGTVITVEVRPRMMSVRGRPIRVTAIRDITKRKRVEEMLEAERRRLFSVLDELPAFIYLQAPDYSIRFANRYFREHFGEPEGKTCYELLWGSKKPCESCPTFRVFDTKKAQEWERTQSITDRIYQVYDYPFTDIDGSLLVLAMGFDITDRKHTEMALKESQEQLFRFMNSASDSFYLLNSQLDLVEINEKGLEIIGKRREDIIGKNIVEIAPDIKASGRYEKYLDVIKTGTPFVIEDFVSHPTFGNLHFILKSFKVGDGLGIIASDITERKRAEEQLQLYTAKLEETNAELSQFAYVVSHDLKTPLRAIRNYADFLCEDLEETLGNEQKAYLQRINQAVREANALIEDLLRLSRIDRLSTDIETLEVGSFLRSLLASLDLSTDVQIMMQDDWPTLEIAPVLFRQIFQNLIGNAIKFNASLQKRIELGWQAVRDDYYELFVRDNGIGIDPSHQNKIFHVFERLHTKEEFEGTGIGLAIVKKAVSKLGGSVRVESTPGEGSTFFVRLSRDQKI